MAALKAWWSVKALDLYYLIFKELHFYPCYLVFSMVDGQGSNYIHVLPFCDQMVNLEHTKLELVEHIPCVPWCIRSRILY